MRQASRTYSFSAAHRLEYHPKCGRLHGHNYTLEVSFRSFALNAEGMVIDFAAMDKVISPIIAMFDHRYIVSQENIRAHDPYAEIAMGREEAVQPNVAHSTAEMLSEWFAKTIQEEINDIPSWRGIVLSEVTLWETPKNKATWKLS